MSKLVCPRCGNNKSFYSIHYCVVEQYYNGDGEEDGCSDVCDSLNYNMRRKSTPIYCLYCKKKVSTEEILYGLYKGG